MNLNHVAQEVVRPLVSIFPPETNEQRPTYGDGQKFQEDSPWPDCVLFCEYFHGDNGAGLGAGSQTRWLRVITRVVHLFATTTAERCLELGKTAVFTEAKQAVNP